MSTMRHLTLSTCCPTHAAARGSCVQVSHGWLSDLRLYLQVSLPTVRKFVKSLEEKALGTKVVKGARPDQQLVKVVNDELIALMGGKQAELNVPNDGPQAGSLQWG